MFKQRLMILTLLLLALVAGCRQEAPPPAAEANTVITFAVENSTMGEDILLIAVMDDKLDPVTVNKLKVRGDMDHAGMVPVIVEAGGSADGQFEVPIEWTMGGDWIVEIMAELANGQTVSETFNINIGVS